MKSISLLTRRQGLSRDEFIAHWVEDHAPRIRRVPEVRRYVLSFITDEPTRPDVPTQDMAVDCIAELWYDDEAALRRASARPEMIELRANGAGYLSRIKTFVTKEEIII